MFGMNDLYCVYMVECADGTIYTGITNDLEKRIAAHNAGKGAKYTRSRLPVKLMWSGLPVYKSSALKAEARIKKLKRSEKLRIIEGTYTDRHG